MDRIEELRMMNPGAEFKRFIGNPYAISEFSEEIGRINYGGYSYIICHVHDIWSQMTDVINFGIYMKYKVAALFNSIFENTFIIMVDDSYMKMNQKIKDFILWHEIGHIHEEAMSSTLDATLLGKNRFRRIHARPEAKADTFSLLYNKMTIDDYEEIMDKIFTLLGKRNENDNAIFDIRRKMTRALFSDVHASLR